VPVTVIATEFTSAMLRTWIAQGAQPVREFTKIRDVDYVDLPTGHWPQFTRPEDLARAILGAVATAAPPVDAPPRARLDEQPIAPRQFHEAGGVEDWRVLFGGHARTFAPGRSRRASPWWTRSAGWPTPRTITPLWTCATTA